MKKSTLLTLENFEELLDRKLEEKLEQKLNEKFDEKLKPIYNELALIKDVTENRIYKELKETRREMKAGFEHLDDVTNAIVLDFNDHEDRIKRLEKRTDVTNNN